MAYNTLLSTNWYIRLETTPFFAFEKGLVNYLSKSCSVRVWRISRNIRMCTAHTLIFTAQNIISLDYKLWRLVIEANIFYPRITLFVVCS